jgi:hypothetical protein
VTAPVVQMHGTHTGPHVLHESPDGSITQVVPLTGREFATRQVHWFRIGRRHRRARRHGHGQTGGLDPAPSYVLRMLLALRRERRAA